MKNANYSDDENKASSLTLFIVLLALLGISFALYIYFGMQNTPAMLVEEPVTDVAESRPLTDEELFTRMESMQRDDGQPTAEVIAKMEAMQTGDQEPPSDEALERMKVMNPGIPLPTF